MKEEKSNKKVSWYPGHIKSAKDKLIGKWVPVLDVVIELVDSRIPVTGKYQEPEIWKNKILINVFTKKDLSDTAIKQLIDSEALIIDGRSSQKWRRSLLKLIKEKAQPIIDKLNKQGRKRNLRIGVCGLPNVGKSTFLNTLAAKKKTVARVENKPGVTRQMQWISCDEVDLLDTPGLIAPSFDGLDAYKFALCNLIPLKIVDPIELCKYLLQYLREFYPELIADIKEPNNPEDAIKIINKFQKGKLGNICLDLDRLN